MSQGGAPVGRGAGGPMLPITWRSCPTKTERRAL